MYFTNLKEAQEAGWKARKNCDHEKRKEWRGAIEVLTNEMTRIYNNPGRISYEEAKRVGDIPYEIKLIREALEVSLPENKAQGTADAHGCEGESL